MAYKVRFVKPDVAYAKYKAELDGAITGCLTTGDLIARKQLREFEENFARFVGTKYCVGVNSGYHALALSMLAAGIGPGTRSSPSRTRSSRPCRPSCTPVPRRCSSR